MKIGSNLYLLLLLPAVALAGTYRWVDDEGNVVYSQTPPPDGREVREIAPPPPPAEDPAAAKKRLEALTEEAEKSSQRRREQKEAQDRKKAEAERRRKNCEAARYNLQLFVNRPPNVLFKMGENEYRRFTPEERQQQIDKLQKIIEENCD